MSDKQKQSMESESKNDDSNGSDYSYGNVNVLRLLLESLRSNESSMENLRNQLR